MSSDSRPTLTCLLADMHQPPDSSPKAPSGVLSESESNEMFFEEMWRVFGSRMARRARQVLRSRRAANEEDVVQDVFLSLWKGIKAGRYPDCKNSDDLWFLLLKITSNKAKDQEKRENAKKRRGDGAKRGESAFEDPNKERIGRGIEQVPAEQTSRRKRVGGCADPTPEEEKIMDEELGRLLNLLTPELRRIAILSFENYSSNDIAVQIGRTPRTVQRKLKRIRIALEEQ